MTHRGTYGYDAPYALIMFALAALGSLAALVLFLWQSNTRGIRFSVFYLLFFAGNACSFFYTTRRGKFIEWERILDDLHLRGDEKVLDLGCGRGAVSTAAAARLTTSGKVIGIDIWNAMDQSGNARDVTLRNAALEGVSDRVRIETGDMRSLPFADATFDLVVSSLAIHNIPTKDERKKAIVEAYRVLLPGGRLVIADIRSTNLYASVLRGLDARNVERRRLGWRFWWGNPIAATSLVTASKV
ncbi:MAG TPA: class I SAM-dependent methyltransferase [Gemmatimonadaceae bacterium]|nr:class I SAM-dependent methyltransferase [Gemmatimonadaceae bacterium]